MESATKQELSYYQLYLLKYLNEYLPEKIGDDEFINQRAENAASVFEDSRLQGYTVEGSQELAMAELLKGLHFSKWLLIHDILTQEFQNEVPGDKIEVLIEKVASRLEAIFSKYDLSDGFEGTPEYNTLYTEITGEIAFYLEEYGI